MKYYYHATRMENLHSIMLSGLNPGVDGLVYMCEKPEDAIKFLAIHGYRDILVCIRQRYLHPAIRPGSP